MRKAWGRRAAWLAVVSLWSGEVRAEDKTIDIERAVRLALENQPELERAGARVDEARGRLTEAETWPLNPNLEGSANARRTSAGTGVDFEIGIGQQIAIGGQIGDRGDAAEAGVEVARLSRKRAKARVATAVRSAFVTALERRDLLAVRARDLELTTELFALARRRMERGAGTQLDLSAAANELARTRTARRTAEAAYRASLANLAERIGIEPTLELRIEGTITATPTSARDDVYTALAERSDLAAVRARVGQARSEAALARAERWPDLTIRAFAGRENSEETLAGGGLSIPIPLFMRNQGGVERADAMTRVRSAQVRAFELRVRREVLAARARHDAALDNAKTLRELVRGTLEPNLDLLRRAFEAGKATWPEVLLLRRTFIDAQRDLITAEAEAARTGFALQLACGRTPLPDAANRGDTP